MVAARGGNHRDFAFLRLGWGRNPASNWNVERSIFTRSREAAKETWSNAPFS